MSATFCPSSQLLGTPPDGGTTLQRLFAAVDSLKQDQQRFNVSDLAVFAASYQPMHLLDLNWQNSSNTNSDDKTLADAAAESRLRHLAEIIRLGNLLTRELLDPNHRKFLSIEVWTGLSWRNQDRSLLDAIQVGQLDVRTSTRSNWVGLNSTACDDNKAVQKHIWDKKFFHPNASGFKDWGEYTFPDGSPAEQYLPKKVIDDIRGSLKGALGSDGKLTVHHVSFTGRDTKKMKWTLCWQPDAPTIHSTPTQSAVPDDETLNNFPYGSSSTADPSDYGGTPPSTVGSWTLPAS